MAPGPEAGAASGSLFQVSLGWGVLRKGNLETSLDHHLHISEYHLLRPSVILLSADPAELDPVPQYELRDSQGQR